MPQLDIDLLEDFLFFAFAAFILGFGDEESEENIIDEWTFDRSDPDLVQVVETLGEKSGHGKNCKLKVVEIPDDIKWYID